MIKLKLESQANRKIHKKKNNFFSLDTNIVNDYLQRGRYDEMFNGVLNLCISPTVYSEMRSNYKPQDFEERVKSFDQLRSCFSLKIPEECVLEGIYSLILNDTIRIKSIAIIEEMNGKRIQDKEKRNEYFKTREKEDWIQEQDFRILAETLWMRHELNKKGKELYFVTHDMNVRKYLPENFLEIVLPEPIIYS